MDWDPWDEFTESAAPLQLSVRNTFIHYDLAPPVDALRRLKSAPARSFAAFDSRAGGQGGYSCSATGIGTGGERNVQKGEQLGDAENEDDVEGVVEEITAHVETSLELANKWNWAQDEAVAKSPRSSPGVGRLVDTKEACSRICKKLLKHDVVSLDIEGINLCRFGEICIIQIATADHEVFLFDICSLKGDAFKHGLQDLLESVEIVKLVWDGRMDGDALFHHFEVILRNVVDLQVLYVLANPLGQRIYENLPGLGKALKAVLEEDEFTAAEEVKRKGRELFEPRCQKGGSHEIWKIRPLPDTLVEYCSTDVIHLFTMLERWGNGGNVFTISSTARQAISELRIYFQIAAYELVRSPRVEFHWMFQDAGKHLAPDGTAYVLEDFVKFYGGVDEWNSSDLSMEVLWEQIEEFCDVSLRVHDLLRSHLRLHGRERQGSISVTQHLPLHMREIKKAFLPGPLGLEIGGADGSILLKLEEGSQGEKSGVRTGYRLRKVNDLPYDQARLRAAMQGSSPFRLTFEVREIMGRRSKPQPTTRDTPVEPGSPTRLTRSVSSGSEANRVCWRLRPGILDASLRMKSSIAFQVGSASFQLILWPMPRNDGRTASFNTSDGKGFVEVKCTGEVASLVRFRIFVGNGSPRGPVLHNFAEKQSAGLPTDSCIWDLKAGVVEDTEYGRYLLIGVEMVEVLLQ